MHRRLHLVVLLAGSLAFAPAARAEWVINGAPVCVQPNSQSEVRVATDSTGGAFIAWDDARTSDDRDFIQRLTGTGAIADCVIALKFVREGWIMQSVEESSAEVIEQATIATSFPIGWTIKDGKLVSPWASIGKPGKAEGAACSVTGRPVLVAGGNVRFSVEPVPPAKKIQFGNPDGDGEYKLTVKNETDQEVEAPALLTDGKAIRWNECVVIRCQDKTYPIPGSTGSVAGLQPVVLKPGESVSGTTQIFALNGPPWPRGGSRLEFQFCLGEKSATHSFYYLSRHHDPIREAIQKELMK